MPWWKSLYTQAVLLPVFFLGFLICLFWSISRLVHGKEKASWFVLTHAAISLLFVFGIVQAFWHPLDLAYDLPTGLGFWLGLPLLTTLCLPGILFFALRTKPFRLIGYGAYVVMALWFLAELDWLNLLGWRY